MVIGVEDEKKILNALLDDDESFIVKKRKNDDRMDSIVKQVRKTIKKRAIDEEEEKQAQIERLEKIKQRIENLRIGISEIEKAVVDKKKSVVESISRNVEIKEEPKATEVKAEPKRAEVREVIKPADTKRVKPKFEEQPYLSDVEINVLKAILRYGANVRRISKATGYPETVISKAIERLIEKGYLDENLNVAEKAIHLAGIPTEEKGIGIKIIDVAIILTAIILVLSTLHYFGYI